jgi:hypothetical protein
MVPPGGSMDAVTRTATLFARQTAKTAGARIKIKETTAEV